MLARILDNLGLRLFVVVFGGFIGLLVACRLLMAIDLTWLLPDSWWPWASAVSGPGPSAPAPPPTNCLPMPDGIEVCESR